MDSKGNMSREIRVFLSSTFMDMEAERNHLIKCVFPKVRAACLARQIGFTEIDLRWGITEKEAKNGATVELCLAEIDRCRDFPPFFIGFLGERYGWIPREEELAAYWARHEDSPYANSIHNAIKRGISVTELEMELAALGEGAAEKLHGHVLFLLRDRTLTDSLFQKEKGKHPNLAEAFYYDPVGDKLATLKGRLRNSGLLNIDGYTSIEQFGEAIERHLFNQIEQHFPADSTPDQQQLTNVAHAVFRDNRLQNFVPRDEVRQALVTAIEERQKAPGPGPIVLKGPSGQGKSAIMADLARYFESVTGYCVIDHYIGADDDTSLDGWVQRVLQTLHPVIADQVSAIPNNPKERTEALPNWLTMAASRMQCRYILILDALDQLDDGGKDIRMLRHSNIGPAATVIASAADDTTAAKSAADLRFELHTVHDFDVDQRKRMIADTLFRYRKKLPQDLSQRIADAPQTGNPLFLMLALEKLRLDANHEKLSENVDAILAHKDAPKLFLNEFLLDKDYALALEFMALLAASRNGLNEQELTELLALPTAPRPRDPISETEEEGPPTLARVYLSQLIAVFKPFLLRKQGNWSPMHSLLGVTALDAYGEEQARKKIAEYFWLGWKSKRNLDRVAIELTGQLWVLHDDKRLKEALTDLEIALRVCKRSQFEFSRYWVEVVRNKGESALQAEKLVRRLLKKPENNHSTWEARTKDSLILASSFRMADEVEWASRIYHGIYIQSQMAGGRISVNSLKAALDGFIRCFLSMTISATEIDEESFTRLIEMRAIATNFMGHLLDVTKNEPSIERAEIALLLSELRDISDRLTGPTRENDELRAKDIADAIIILEDGICKRDALFHDTISKAYVMKLKANMDSIARPWNTPTRNKIINQTREESESFKDYEFRHLLPGHPQRVLLLEQLHCLYSLAAEATQDSQESREFWLAATEYAWSTIDELKQSYFSGYQHDMRLLNAAETISLALAAGCPDHRNIFDYLLHITNPEKIAEFASHQVREYSREIHSRLLQLSKP